MIKTKIRVQLRLALVRTANAVLELASKLGPAAESEEADDDAPGNVDPEVSNYMLNHPALEHRRVVFDVHQIMHMIWDSLHRRGAPVSRLVGGKWLWAKTKGGEPVLAFIRPGFDA